MEAVVLRRGRVQAIFVGAVGVLALLTVFAIELSNTQASSKADVRARVHERGVLAGALIDSLFTSLQQAIPQDARTYGAEMVSARTMDKNRQAGGYLVLLTRAGQVLAHSGGFTAQARADVASSAALRLVRAGHPYGLGNLLPYGRSGIIDSAVAFPTAYGVRVLLTGFEPSELGGFLTRDLREIPGVSGAENYVLDGNGRVLASTDPARPVGRMLGFGGPLGSSRNQSGDRGGRYVDETALSNATWRIVLTAPDRALFASVSGLRLWLPWLILIGFGLVSLVALVLGRRTLRAAERVGDANALLERLKLDAEKANDAKSVFLSRTSHELRTPLNAILGFGQLLSMGELDERRSGYVQRIITAGSHLLDLINEILDISRIESGELTLSPEPISVGAVINDAVDLVTPIATARAIEINVELEGGPYWARADLQRLKQVLLNLLSNAIKYNRDGGRVDVGVTQNGDVVAVQVSDGGPGIAPELLAKLFQPFERLGAERGPVEGTGLGLTLSKGMIEAMGGTITVQSTPGTGTCFTVQLPAVAPPAHSAVDLPSRAETHTRDAKQAVLCIEDNPSNLTLIDQVFSMRPQIELLTAVQGTLGLELAREHLPGLILLDLNLPDIKGTQVLARLKADPRTQDIPVVVVSADASDGQVERLAAAGAETYLTKPIDVRKLLDVVDEVLDASITRAA
jgi:signal transduction histidine kinase/CheY-like chemotaxis protein